MAADAAISFGVVIVGFIMTFTDLYWLDPVVSIAIALIIFWGTWDLFKDSVNLALDAVPGNIDKQAIEAYLDSVEEIESYHDLHIWAMSTTETALTVHIVISEDCNRNRLIRNISDELKRNCDVVHSTIQIEDSAGNECTQNEV
jgi:cobalt-zinc-cadmium efflux system protein